MKTEGFEELRNILSKVVDSFTHQKLRKFAYKIEKPSGSFVDIRATEVNHFKASKRYRFRDLYLVF